MRILIKIRAGIRSLLGWFPLTPGGLVLLVGAFIALRVFGMGRSDLLMWVLGGLGFAIALFALLAVMFAAARVAFAAGRGQDESPVLAECSHPAVTGFQVPTLWWIPGVAVEWTWLEPDVDVTLHPRKGWLRERVVPKRRGEAQRIVREFVVSDAFGIARVRFRRGQERRFRAVPHMGALQKIHVVQGLAGGDAMSHPDGRPVGDRFDMRHYTPGDPIRFILWKVFAKNRELVVRTPEQAISPIQQTVAYLVAGPGDEPSAGAARVVVGHGAMGGDWSLGADGVDGEASTQAEALDSIVKSAATDPSQSAAGLHRFLASAPGGTRRAVVFVPPTPGPWIDRVVDASRKDVAGSARLDFVICIDGLQPRAKRGIAGRLLFTSEPEVGPGANREELARVIQALSATRGRVLVVDRVAGQVLPASHLKALGVAA
ncbi:MAG: hypothetical protein ACJAZO_001510 [Myxococcota bacterium]